MKREHIRFYIFVGLLFLLAGSLLGSPWLLRNFQQQNAQPLFVSAKAQSVAPENTTIYGNPNHIELPNIGISVDVVPGYYDKSSQTWTLSLNKAHFATITPEPNNKSGNTFIYGHNRPEVFSRLLNAKVGDKAIVTTSNGHVFTYVMHSRRDTKPTDSSLLNYEGSPILTLQTCSGFWYQNRSLFIFTLQEAH